jgi:tRNA-dihydrouridine synthase B
MTMQIGHWTIKSPDNGFAGTSTPPVILAPMAGVTDKPFRQLCRQLGAAHAVSEMVTSRPDLRNSKKTRTRLDHRGEQAPVAVQILGTDPQQMAEAAQFNVASGADIIDINMGCPAKKVCNVAAGSALMQNEPLVKDILTAVIDSVAVPVTLKIRTGWDTDNRNALNIARIAEDSGIHALTIHGRTRACGYSGEAEYETIKQVKQQLAIPVIANGDISTAEKARFVLEYTGADALMIGRQAIKSPWIFSDINHYLKTGTHLNEPDLEEKKQWILRLMKDLYQFYGQAHGTRIARKHISAIVKPLPEGDLFWQKINRVSEAEQQFSMTDDFLTTQCA